MKNNICCLFILSTACAFLNAAETPDKAAPPENPALRWQAMARSDLAAVQALVLSTHPGSIDDGNPAFRDWMTTGYQQALALIPKVVTYDTAMSAVRFYVTGFLDGHFGYSDNARRRDYPILINGWRLRKEKGHYVVTAVAKEWASPLPQQGARLIACDGRAPALLIKEFVAPYVDRRDFPAVTDSLAGRLMTLPLAGEELKRCRFEAPDGKITDLDIRYAAVNSRQYFQIIMQNREQPRRVNEFTLDNGVLWIRAANFNVNEDGAEALASMLTALSAARDVRQIIFDSRGNAGGDSGVGDRLFEAATGGLEFDRSDMAALPRTYAQWRVSDTAIATAERTQAHLVRLYGAKSTQAQEAAERLAAFRSARAAGQPWVEQEGGQRLTRDDIARRHGHLRRFQGGIALITDSNCVSACLDFADLIRQVPGAVHLGQATSGDAVYIDVGYAELPSKNLLFLPLKVWRNRLRGNNEALVPDIALDVDMDDDAAVQAAARAALRL